MSAVTTRKTRSKSEKSPSRHLQGPWDDHGEAVRSEGWEREELSAGRRLQPGHAIAFPSPSSHLRVSKSLVPGTETVPGLVLALITEAS